METGISESKTSVIIGLFAGMIFLIGGCHPTPNNPPPALPSAQTPLQSPGAPGEGQQVFASDDQAAQAMVDAVKAEDHERVHAILGPAWKELVSGDKVEDANAFKEFAGRAAEHTRLQKTDDKFTTLYVGKDDWPFPIPITRTDDGKWFFDTEAGKAEILARRIGANELETIPVCRAYVQAQEEYASKDRDGSGILKYAQRILSHPGKTDGLYWDPADGQEQSPLGPLMVDATMEGYDPKVHHPHEPYHGYRFRILKKQGPAASGGAADYVVNGNMIGGFALVAYPAEYGSSGVMTFIINHSQKLYQKNLGPDTSDLARKMAEFNPDDSWTLVKD